ncbi:MAG TPA: dihydrolipoyl dehydrogenase [Parachlamydiaceae bacterium]|nr:dihydrolipoyl dehydrogenase [Parachlamydiaceae bacterium]
MTKYDVAVVGAGPGGYVAAIRAAQLGLKTVCIEKENVGGTCLNVGCIPSKALLQSTESYFALLEQGQELGLLFHDLRPNFDQMMKRKAGIVEGLVLGVKGAFKKKQVESIEGTARFIDAHKIEVIKGSISQEIEADHFIIATGSSSIPLPFLPFDEKKVLSSTGALSLKEIPKKLLVVGAGVIGVELASVYNRLNTEVIIIEMLDEICYGLDTTISKAFLQILKKQGLQFHLGSKVKSGKVEKEGVSLELILPNEELLNLEADAVLVSIGRRAFTEGLGLEKIDIALNDKNMIRVNGSFQTNIPHIYAIGDVIDGPMLAHKASEEGIAAAEIIAGLNPKVNYMAIPGVIYTHPEVASVGLTEQEAKALNLELLIGTCSFKANPRARCIGYTEGLVKVIGEKKTGRLLGLHILGLQASEMIGEGVMAIQKKATLEEIASASHAHPTLSEAILEATQNALGKAIHL